MAAGYIIYKDQVGTGTVTSVGLSLPVSVFSISGSPVTTSGTLTGTFINQNANTVFAGPTSGGAAAPAFRALVNADISTLASVVQNTTVAISSAQILNSNSSPVTILASPGSGNTYEILNIICRLNFVSAAYATNTTIAFIFSGAGGAIATDSQILLSTVTRTGMIVKTGLGATPNTSYLFNTALTMRTNTGNPTAGDGTMDVFISYRVITF